MKDTPTPPTDAERGQSILAKIISDTAKALKFREEAAETWSKGSDQSWRKAGCRLTKAERRATAESNRRIASKFKQQLEDLNALERQIPRWREIESAPRGGTKILLRGRFSITGMESIEIGKFDFEYNGELVFIVGITRFHAVGWMPLPEPPKP